MRRVPCALMDNVEPLYFLTLGTLLVIFLIAATVQTVKKRRSARTRVQSESSPNPAPTSGS